MILKNVSLFLKSKYFFLASFSNNLDKFSRLKPQKENAKKKKKCTIRLQSCIMTCQKYILMNTMICQVLKEVKWIPNLTLDEYDYSEWYKELDNLPKLEGDEENYYTASSTSLSKSDKKEGKGSKILTRNKLLTRFPIVLAQIKAGSNSNNLKNEIRQKVYLLYQHNITKKIYNNLIKSL